MNTIIQISAGLAPEEALRFVELLAGRFVSAVRAGGARVEKRGVTKRSMVRLRASRVSSACAEVLTREQGTHVLHSGSRGRGARKRWFVGVLVYADIDVSAALMERDVEFSVCRAGGPGGQHVNRTQSAVRAFHRPSGIAVRVQGSRSQHQNKSEAMKLLAQKLKEVATHRKDALWSARRRSGFAFERGNAVREYVLDRNGHLVVREKGSDR